MTPAWNEPAAAPDGTPQTPCAVKVRGTPAESCDEVRVSSRRQIGRVWKPRGPTAPEAGVVSVLKYPWMSRTRWTCPGEPETPALIPSVPEPSVASWMMASLPRGEVAVAKLTVLL